MSYSCTIATDYCSWCKDKCFHSLEELRRFEMGLLHCYNTNGTSTDCRNSICRKCRKQWNMEEKGFVICLNCFVMNRVDFIYVK